MKNALILHGTDADKALGVMREAGQRLRDKGVRLSQWWETNNLSLEVLGEYAKPNEFYVALVGGVPAAAAIIQEHQTLQDWSAVDGDAEPKALYVHYLAVARAFVGQGLPKAMLEFAASLARDKGIPTLRLDTNADEPKLRGIYESCGFSTVTVLDEEHGRTALYEKRI